ncbi:MAG: 16S rRNA (cytosine(1402)-N(4))-methyltransferase RsmH [Pseudomonadota bacterium]|nr:16S rRNA (cytosine(1402)-N(4))-methyltransferase [Pseudomonadales bacterium]MDY6918914.1 16S rRNA (cytosine(1402)-N(4))-methyltransferase RsmH [Pseudomonadota bacterium]
MAAAEHTHETVMLQEAVDALVINESGIYIDGTYGRGGHSRRILQRLAADGRLLAFDKDPQALADGRALMTIDSRFSIVHDSFAALGEHLQALQLNQGVDGILLDLGVSSPQLDDPARGFSFQADGPLDMRMNNAAGETAAQWLARAEQDEIARVVKEYGEERYARRIARAIVESRQAQPLTTTAQLAALVARANPSRERGKHPATRTFQGIRIHINRELEDLEQALGSILDCLKPGARLVVISFHSLEDRLVKRFIQRKEKGDPVPRHLPVRDTALNRELRSVGKAVKASSAEVARNPRARSAIMRVAEKLA